MNMGRFRFTLSRPRVFRSTLTEIHGPRIRATFHHRLAHYMMDVSQRHPRMDQLWNRWSDRPVNGSFDSYVYAARFFPSVWLKLVEQEGR